jgi:flagellar basal body-associated protein FliL
MGKHIIIGLFLISAMLMLSSTASAFTVTEVTELKDTTIEFVPYREIAVNQGVVYQVKLTNTGEKEKTYEITPDALAIRTLGTYRIDPSDRITLEPGKQQTFYLYLSVEKGDTGRTEIPVKIESGSSETTIELVARPIGPFKEAQQDAKPNILSDIFKIVLAILLVIVILIAVILGFRKIRKRKDEETDEELKPEFEEEVETYY